MSCILTNAFILEWCQTNNKNNNQTFFFGRIPKRISHTQFEGPIFIWMGKAIRQIRVNNLWIVLYVILTGNENGNTREKWWIIFLPLHRLLFFSKSSRISRAKKKSQIRAHVALIPELYQFLQKNRSLKDQNNINLCMNIILKNVPKVKIC